MPTTARSMASFGPLKTWRALEPLQSSTSSAQTEQVDGALAFILSGRHIGYLPVHIAAPWQATGRLRALEADSLGFDVQFHLASHRGQHPGDAQRVFVEDLLGAFGAGQSTRT